MSSGRARCFVGSADEITYDERWGGVLEGLDHTQAMQAAHVLPILRPWLIGGLGG